MAKKAAKKSTGLSLNPSTFVAGGLLPDGIYKVTAAEVTKYDYDGKSDQEVCAIHLTFQEFDKKTKKVGKDKKEMYYSCGPTERFVPMDADGEACDEGGVGVTLAEDSAATGLSKQCNAFQFLSKLADCGFNSDLLDKNDVTVFAGLILAMRQEAQKARRSSNVDEEEGEVKTLALPYEILFDPNEEGKGGKKKAKPAPAEDEDGDDDEEAGDDDEEAGDDDEEESDDAAFHKAVATVMGKNKKGCDRSKLKVAIFKVADDEDEGEAFADAVSDDDRLIPALKACGYKLKGKAIVLA